jgi:hypothetical protein
MKKLVLVAMMIVTRNAAANLVTIENLFGDKPVRNFIANQADIPAVCDNYSGTWTATCEAVAGEHHIQMPPQQAVISQNGCAEITSNNKTERIGEIMTDKMTVTAGNGQPTEIGYAGISRWNEDGTVMLSDGAGIMNLQTRIESFSITGGLHRINADSLESKIHVTYKTMPEMTVTCLYTKNAVK